MSVVTLNKLDSLQMTSWREMYGREFLPDFYCSVDTACIDVMSYRSYGCKLNVSGMSIGFFIHWRVWEITQIERFL